jgi:hypothetical protein
MNLTRKEFFSTVVTAVAGAAGAAWLAGCGSSDDDDDGSNGGDCLTNGTRITIADNHGHTLTVSKADVMMGAAHTYDITGTGGHTHMVTISAGAFGMLASNQSVMTVSTTGDNHTHGITVGCA